MNLVVFAAAAALTTTLALPIPATFSSSAHLHSSAPADLQQSLIHKFHAAQQQFGINDDSQLILSVEKKEAGDQKRLVSRFEGDAGVWMTEDEILTSLIQKHIGFIDITDGDLEKALETSSSLSDSQQQPHAEFAVPTKPSQQTIVEPLIANISTSAMQEFLTTFSNFRTRYYKSGAGKESGTWLFNTVSELAGAHAQESTNMHHGVSVRQFEHSWGQHSVIARIEPKKCNSGSSNNGTFDDHVVIVGAHQDSVNQWNPWFGRSPGADDDGSGTTTTIEAFKLILESGYVPCRPLEFHWYSAEEGGLLGSQKVAASYKSKNVPVAGMFQVDMTGYTPPNKKPIIGVSTDFVDTHQSDFLRVLVEEYSGIGWANTKCGYGCSDHASWHKLGYPAVFTFESDFNDHSPYIHTADDSIDHIDFGHMSQFVKAVLGWAVEMSS